MHMVINLSAIILPIQVLQSLNYQTKFPHSNPENRKIYEKGPKMLNLQEGLRGAGLL